MSLQAYNLAFVFPGQGSQSVGMLDNLAIRHPEVRRVFEQASDVLGRDLWAIAAKDLGHELDQTCNTQPAMLAAGVAVWEVWCGQSDVRPAWMAGHSLGEYTALVCSEALSFEDGIRLVEARGRLMQAAVPEGVGAMAAILGLDDHRVIEACAESADDEVVSAVNFNTEGQVVIAGNIAAVGRAMRAAKALGAKRAVLLPVSVPSHCALMQPAAEKLGEQLQSIAINIPKTMLIHNVDVASHSSPDVIRNVLKEQLYKSVRWADTIRFMRDQGVTRFVECGPGKVLLGLNKRIAKDLEHHALYNSETLNDLMEAFNDN
ncbi:MAG: ACP S-malonyltransferase [Methylovulum sp.]|nr:ACP S-malonyltransferase [Methylovulum sp.]